MTTTGGNTLPRSLGLPLLVLYGLGVIIGAGIYVLIGAVVARAGMAMPLSFVLAGGVAALTGLCYAELAARYPEAGGAPVYVQHAFGSVRLSQFTGIAVAAVIAVSAAAIARGSAGYSGAFIALPDAILSGATVAMFIGIACLRVRQSVGLAAIITAVEIGGLLFLLVAGAPALSPARLGEILPADVSGWGRVASGAFLAFFAFIGFENFANMAEEAKDPARTLPRAIILSVALSTALYAAVATVAVLAVPVEQLVSSPAPLLLLAGSEGGTIQGLFLPIALLAVANGILVEILVLARLLFGMARRGWMPAGLAALSPRLQTPVRATLVGGFVVLVLTMLLDVTALARLTSTITLLLFALVTAALWRLHRDAPKAATAIRMPRWVPPLATFANVALAAMSFAF